MSKIKESAFDGAPGGMNGAISYAPTYGTFASPSVSQNPNSFTSNNGNKALGCNSNTRQDVTNQADLNKDVDTIFSKKEKPSADDVISGLEFEMGRMVKKDKSKAKEIVLGNLKKDPHYYRNLNQLNSSEEALTQNMKEQKVIKENIDTNNVVEIRDGVNISETKKIFADMYKAKENKYYVDPRLLDAYRQSVENKNNRKLDFKDKLD